MKTTDIRMAFLLALLLVLPLQGQAQEVHKANPGSPQATALYPKAPNTIRLVSYNVGAFTKYTSGSYASIARMMLELDADAVALQELDSCTTRTGGIFQIDRLARLMRWHYAYAPAMPYRGGSYGIGVVCRNRIGHHYTIALPPGGEPRTVAVVELDDCIVASTHLDLQAETQVREAEYINRIFTERYGESNKPVFLLGDLNAQPDSPTLQTLKQHWTVLSVEGNTYSSRLRVATEQRRALPGDRLANRHPIPLGRRHPGIGPSAHLRRCRATPHRVARHRGGARPLRAISSARGAISYTPPRG